MNQPNESPVKRKRGAQPGNKNARTHGFYSAYARCCRAAKEEKIHRAADIARMDRDIAAARAKLAAVVRHTPDNYRVILLAVGSVARLYSARYHRGEAIKTAVLDALRESRLPPRLTSAALEAAVVAANLSPAPSLDSNIQSHD
ncbi:hypothetical protein DGWBC_1739 [Dehalogenimonas sp. WBC-2]|nr:hypothetical protein DGWBC_1158 [Dehalogenimonas sp. WBC-2]AKG54359.1 hypothetical protein DGWBC_1739 [Dehalogenimonas sp. WBC-2]